MRRLNAFCRTWKKRLAPNSRVSYPIRLNNVQRAFLELFKWNAEGVWSIGCVKDSGSKASAEYFPRLALGRHNI
jgi:hypothetical protein